MQKNIISTLHDEFKNLSERLTPEFEAINKAISQNSNIIYYSSANGMKIAQRYYPEYRQFFVGFGLRHTNEGSVCMRDVSLEMCLSYCHSVRMERGQAWNGMWYRPRVRACCCQLNENGHMQYDGLLHYRFT